MKTLIIFEIDGTLLDSAQLHQQIVTNILASDGLDAAFQPWREYREYTDLAVLDELFLRNYGRSITAEELARYEDMYEEALVSHLGRARLMEIPGAGVLLAELAEFENVVVAFATGSLRKMAAAKLSLFGISADDVTLANGTEHMNRAALVEDAIARAMGDSTDPCQVVLVGSDVWDAKAAAELRLPFVAVERGGEQFGTGALLSVADFSELHAAELLDLTHFREMASSLP